MARRFFLSRSNGLSRFAWPPLPLKLIVIWSIPVCGSLTSLMFPFGKNVPPRQRARLTALPLAWSSTYKLAFTQLLRNIPEFPSLFPPMISPPACSPSVSAFFGHCESLPAVSFAYVVFFSFPSKLTRLFVTKFLKPILSV